MKTVASAFAIILLSAQTSLAGEYVVNLREIPIMKSVYGQVQSQDIVPARARIGGTMVEILVEEGDAVAAGDMIANVADQKLALQLEAIAARQSAIVAQLENARTNLERANQLYARGTIAKTRLDELNTRYDVLTNQLSAIESEKAVIVRQAEEGAVIAPASGRVLSVPVTIGSVILPGETVARIAGGGRFLRLALPERHAAGIRQGESVSVGARGISPQQETARALTGTIAKVYPEIADGRITADVSVEGLGDFFVGERTLVSIPVGTRQTLAVPASAVSTRFGIDYVTISNNGAAKEVTVIPGATLDINGQAMIEILTGLHAGDKVLVP